jgi:type II secretory pathway component HofQ
MPKKTTYSRSGAQHGKPKQKSFELVRPVSDDNVLETVENSEDAEVEEVEMTETVVEEAERKRPGAKASPPTPVASVAASSAPKSASARMAARRQAAQKPQQRSAASLIAAENYSYVRKDLLFILILAIIMFSAIIVLHFVIGG